MNRDLKDRHGVSLMEVLFSIGVISVGLMGVAALLPLAANQVRKGEEAEQGAMLGMNALNEIELRGYTYASDLDGDGDFAGTALGEIETIWFHPDYNVGTTIGPRTSVCIDPRYVADNVGGGSAPTFFPHYTPPAPPTFVARMRRVTVRVQNQAASSGATFVPMSAEMAERIFVDHDRIDYTRPKDDTLPAEQLYDLHGPTSIRAVPKLIDSRRQLSWFATLVPKLGPGAGAGKLATLSVVIVEGRPSLLTRTDPVALDTERLAVVSNFYAGGIGGGDVQLTAPVVETLEQVKVGHWIMLSSKARIQTGGTPILQDWFAWYRVGAKTEIEGMGPYTIDVTLNGPDWDRREWTSGSIPTQAVIVEGAVGVYERSIRREIASMWN